MTPEVATPYPLSFNNALSSPAPPRSPNRQRHYRFTSSTSISAKTHIREVLQSFRDSLQADVNMALTNQHSTQRALNQLLGELGPPRYIDSTIRVNRHQRNHSSIGIPRRDVPETAVPAEIRAQVGGRSSLDVLDLARVSKDETPGALVPPEVRLTRPSLPPQAPLPPPPVTPGHSTGSQPMHPFAAVVALMEEGDSPSRRRSDLKGKSRDPRERPAEGRQQTPRKGLMGPNGIIARAASRASLPRMKSATLRPIHRPDPVTPIKYAPSTPRRGSNEAMARGLPEVELVEIPRFKKRELNMGIVEGDGPWRMAWIGLWMWWIINALLTLYFDVNILFILVQCVIHPGFNGSRGWVFATSAYAICLGISSLVVWFGWEVMYEFWRRWRLAQPAIEPIYLSLPASLHLSLSSYHHFIFLLHIRLSPLGTPHARDTIPETCYSLVQLIPGLLPLLPRAGIALVLLLSFDHPQGNVQTPFGGTDQTRFRDGHYFRADKPGQLTQYAKGLSIAFIAIVALRLLVALLSVVGLWLSSGRPLGGIVGSKWQHRKRTPTQPRTPKSSLQPRDPSKTASPQKSWQTAENEFDWAWRERTRARIQDAFELCMMRRNFSADVSVPLMSMPPARSSGLLAAPEFLFTPTAQHTSNIRHVRSLGPPRPESGVIPSGPSQAGTSDLFYTPQQTRERHAATEFGVIRRHSPGSEESVADDSTGLLETGTGASDHTNGGSSRSPSARQRSATSPGGRVISRARSTSVSLLKESLANGAVLVKRARSGTVLSTDSLYSKVEEDGEVRKIPKIRSMLEMGKREESQ